MAASIGPNGLRLEFAIFPSRHEGGTARVETFRAEVERVDCAVPNEFAVSLYSCHAGRVALVWRVGTLETSGSRCKAKNHE